jgi:prepilin-type N-terminal cleavage/methylation domain-containing protein
MILFSSQKNNTALLSAQQKGFTLMEVMVSISIFAIIITIGIGSLLTIFQTLQKTRADRQTLDSISFMMDTMTRRMRTAQKINLVSSEEVQIVDQDNDRDPGIITFLVDQTSDFQKLVMIDKSGIPYDLTPQDFKIKEMTFEQYGGINAQQGMIAIHIDGITENGRANSPVLIQTIVSKRILDYSPDALRRSNDNSGVDRVQ